MKTLFNTLLFILLSVSSAVQAQGVTFTSFIDDTTFNELCGLDYTIEISPISNNYTAFGDGNFIVNGTNLINSTLTATVNWGDGTITTHTGTAVTTGSAIAWSPVISHTYSSVGLFTYNILLYDSVSTDSINTGLDVIVGACPVSLSYFANLDCNGDGITDSSGLTPPLVLNSINNTLNYTPYFQTGNSALFSNIQSGNYTVSVDPNWLSSNNYTITSISPTTLYVDSLTQSILTTQIILGCDSTSFISNCLNGIAFCDGNNNGIMDSLELPVGGAPITLHLPNGTIYTMTSDPNGLYGFNYTGIASGGYVSIDQNWLNTNGYSVSTLFSDSLSSLDCSLNAMLNIPIICDSSALSSCISGFVFCDANNNGILDTNETTIGGAPMSLVLTNGNLNLFSSNPDGSYNLTYYNPGNLSGDMFVHWPWLDSMNYFYSPFDNIITNANCDSNVTSNVAVICDTNALSVGCIDGYVYCDDNNNGIFDSTETAYYNAPVILNGLGGLITIYTDSNGYYSYTGWQLSGGNVTININTTWQFNNNAFLNGNGLFLNSLDCANNNQTDIGLNCNSTVPCADLWSSVTPWIGYFQNFNNSVWLKYGNYGSSAPGSYTVTLDFPSGVTPVLSSINNPNYTITGNTITWTLNSSATNMYFSDVIYFSTPTGIPDSTLHIYSSTISSATADCDSSNNYYTLNMLVGLSYDPNDKSVNLPPIVNPNIQDEYTYLVRFQNTGTAPAQDVFILDTLSTNLDWNTFQILETSHPMQLVNMGNGLVKFDFPQIWLPDSTSNEPMSHGHVIYRIKELATLGEGDVIENTAYIYFDQNPPIITNTTVNTNTMSLGIEAIGSIDFNVFPNPARSEINVQAESNIESIRIVSLTGQLVYENSTNSTTENINIEALSSGLYNIEIKSGDGIGRRLFVKQ